MNLQEQYENCADPIDGQNRSKLPRRTKPKRSAPVRTLARGCNRELPGCAPADPGFGFLWVSMLVLEVS